MRKIFNKLIVTLIVILATGGYCNLLYASLPQKVKVSDNDANPGFLNGKLVAGSNITFNEIGDGENETLVINAIGGGTGSAQVLDLGDDGSNESTDLAEIATTGDTNNIFTEPTDDKLLIDLTKDWPKADDADDVTCVGCLSDSELATDFISEIELDSETELEAQLTDVTNVFTNNDGALNDDDLSNDSITALSDVSAISGNTTTIATTSGVLTSGNAAGFDANGNIIDVGALSGEWTDAGTVLEPNTDGDGIRLNNSAGTQTADITYNGTTFSINLSAGNYRLDDLTNCDTIDTDADGDLICGTDASGAGGTPNILDLGDDGSNESVDLVEIATVNDTNSIFNEPAADKLLIDLALNWPSADTADALDANPADCSADQFATTIAANGDLTCSQPTLSNLSDADSTTPADGQLLLFDGVTDNRYENKTMSGDVTITAAGVTSIQPASVDAGDYSAASIDGDDVNSNIAGNHLTLTAGSPDTLDVDVELEEFTITFGLESPVDTDDALVQHKFSHIVTILRVSCSTDVGTVTIQLDERAEATPNSVGTDVMTSTLVCDTNTEATTVFTNAGIAADVPLNLDIEAVASSPGVVRIHVDYSIDD